MTRFARTAVDAGEGPGHGAAGARRLRAGLDPASAPAKSLPPDKTVDRSSTASLAKLITHMMENPRNISAALDILFVAKAIERIGDHATNMTEYVVYMVQGRMSATSRRRLLVRVSTGG
jgi:phosphate transport system protein